MMTRSSYVRGSTPWQRNRTGAALRDIVGDLPHLDGAACRGEHRTFDAAPVNASAREYALGICASCPAQLACTQWLASLPPDQVPAGVVAGVVVSRSAPDAPQSPQIEHSATNAPKPVPGQRDNEDRR